ncbi:histidine phosphatase superfamily [Aspergillus granulosus]|uniref:Histidine phosphatase superfamily n=1 Tax=Aspergillus granulosus TaxID=176169 RepID=A0ABR4H5G0_9EURO
MGKPRMIILIRHAQSEGNKNREIHQTIPDHRVKLTPDGHRQALEAGTRLRGLLRPDDTIHFFTSPYRRTRETTEGILQSLTADTPSPSPFPRHTIKVYEEPRLREQDFGNFQPCSAEMERMWLERADYGHFFYRIPNGESAADAYDRVSGFNESLWRLFGEKDFASVCVLVTHGMMTRVFLMKWYHWSVEYFEDLRNINHCEFVIMKLNEDNGKYVLQNQLRTWSELKKAKELEHQRERTARGLAPPHQTTTPAEPSVPIRRKWGGCPDGCNHGVPKKTSRSSRVHGGDQPRNDQDGQNKQAQQQTSQEKAHNTTTFPAEGNATNEGQTPDPALGDLPGDEAPRKTTLPKTQYPNAQAPVSDSEQATQSDAASNPHHHTYSSPEKSTKPTPKRPNLVHFHRDSEDHLLHPPRLNYGMIHLVGRDGGGTLSGANSVAASEDEHDCHHNHHHHHHDHHNHHEHRRSETTRAGLKRHKPRPSQDLDNDGDDEGSGRQTPKVRRTRSHNPRHDTDGEEDALEQARKEDQSVRGSVY